MSTERKGIDVSEWQGVIDWQKVAADGVAFAMIRLGYGSRDGSSCAADKHYRRNVEGALENGIAVGCYFYSYALTAQAARNEAAFVIQQLADYKGRILYPIAYDIEDSSQQELGRSTLTDMVTAFCSTLEEAGYYACFYTNCSWVRSHLDMETLSRFDFWLARWGDTPVCGGHSCGIWQHTSEGTVAGIAGKVDMNIAYTDYESLIRERELNGYRRSGTSDPPLDPPDAETPPYKVDDIVRFTGSVHYADANADTGSSCTPGRARVTARAPGARHPYHLVHTDAGSTVYGWVDAQDVAPMGSESFSVGDLVRFSGGFHYKSADASASSGQPDPGSARVTVTAPGKKHPYHVVHTDGTSTVYGWVDADTLTKL